MDAEIEKTFSTLCSRHINGIFAENHAEANQKILALIPKEATLAIGDSTSMRQLGILPGLRKRGTKILNPLKTQRRGDQRRGIQKEKLPGPEGRDPV